jgi:hypothetical protein
MKLLREVRTKADVTQRAVSSWTVYPDIPIALRVAIEAVARPPDDRLFPNPRGRARSRLDWTRQGRGTERQVFPSRRCRFFGCKKTGRKLTCTKESEPRFSGAETASVGSTRKKERPRRSEGGRRGLGRGRGSLVGAGVWLLQPLSDWQSRWRSEPAFDAIITKVSIRRPDKHRYMRKDVVKFYK